MTESETADVYYFGCTASSPGDVSAAVVGNKAANLIRMTKAGLAVPSGFVLPTSFCRAYYQHKQERLLKITDSLRRGVLEIEKATGLVFGADRKPLLVAVRSGAPFSMPGMLETILNVGLCCRTLPALLRMTGNPRHAWDSYRRLVQTFGEVVLEVPAQDFEHVLEEHLAREGVPTMTELDVDALKRITREFLDLCKQAKGGPFPQDPMAQLEGAVRAVFGSWQSPKAVEYRRLHGLDNNIGTAVTIQAMVFGNMGGTSGSGVGFTRNPATGANELYLDFLPNAQGEDVVSGRCPVTGAARLQETHPELYRELKEVKRRLESLFHDAQDFEFTVQEGHLYLLQTRSAKRTAWAALRIACEQVAEGMIDESTALKRLTGHDLNAIQQLRLVANEQCRPIGVGVPASPGVAVGEAVFESEVAVRWAKAGRSSILIRHDTSTADITGLAASVGLLTARGGRTSHAAVVARQLNKPCIVGCRDLRIEEHCKSCRIGDHLIEEGAVLSLDGHSGQVYAGKLEISQERPVQYLTEVERWKARFAEGAPSRTVT